MSETDLVHRLILAAPDYNCRLLRNNCGVAIHPDAICKCGRPVKATGRWVRYGVGNPGGSDLIGWTRTKDHAIFTAVEAKVGRGKPSNDQSDFIHLIQTMGGIAGVVRSVTDLEQLLKF